MVIFEGVFGGYFCWKRYPLKAYLTSDENKLRKHLWKWPSKKLWLHVCWRNQWELFRRSFSEVFSEVILAGRETPRLWRKTFDENELEQQSLPQTAHSWRRRSLEVNADHSSPEVKRLRWKQLCKVAWVQIFGAKTGLVGTVFCNLCPNQLI